MYFENIKILWRPHEKEIDEEAAATEGVDGEHEMELLYPSGDGLVPTEAKIDELKELISDTLPKSFSAEVLEHYYGWLDHGNGMC